MRRPAGDTETRAKALFVDIRRGDADAVRARLDARPELVAATATAPPRKDDGQSPLQVALKAGRFPIAHLLLDRGADVDFQERSEVNPWTAPVLHDAIRAGVMSARWLRPAVPDGWAPANDRERADAAHAVLRRMVDAGADIGATDSYGNPALHRAVLDARQVLPTYRHSDPTWVDPKPLNPELVDDLHRVFDVLLVAGADPGEAPPTIGQPIAAFYAAEPVARFLGRPPGR